MVKMWSAARILKMTEPGELFSGNPDTLREEFIALNKKWHPSVNGDTDEANEVTKQINVLYTKAQEAINKGTWKTPGILKLKDTKGRVHNIRFKTSDKFELGRMYICGTIVLYLIDRANKDLVDKGLQNIKSFKFANDKMKSEMEKYLPKVIDTFETTDGFIGVVIEKTPDLFSLKDLLAYHDGKIPCKHAAWIESVLHNILCYLDYTGLVHNGITLDSVFISPLYHGGALLGGWWYSSKKGEKMVSMPAKVFSILPPKVIDTKLASNQTDMESIRLIGREISGDPSGMRLHETDMPETMVRWMKAVSSKTAVENYNIWNKVLDEAFGKRTFVKMEINDKQFYDKINKNKENGGM